MDVLKCCTLNSYIVTLEIYYLDYFPLNSTSRFEKIEIAHIRNLIAHNRYSFSAIDGKLTGG